MYYLSNLQIFIHIFIKFEKLINQIYGLLNQIHCLEEEEYI